MQGKQISILNNSKTCHSSDTFSLQQSNIFDLVDMPPITTVFNKKQSTVLDNVSSIGDGKDHTCHKSTLTTDHISSIFQNNQSKIETIYPKSKRSEQGLERKTANVNLVDEHIIEKNQSTAKVETIKHQSNILDNTTTINDDKGYAYNLNILISDSDSVRHHPRSNFEKNQSDLLLERI